MFPRTLDQGTGLHLSTNFAVHINIMSNKIYVIDKIQRKIQLK